MAGSAINNSLSGMSSNSILIDVASSNIANASTVGYKKAYVLFQDVYAGSSLGGSGKNAVGGGVTTSTALSFSSGTLNATGNSLDLGIKGSGFFMLDVAGARTYTRDGTFAVNQDGLIVNKNSGGKLQGLRPNGTFGDLSVSTQNMTPKATSQITYGLNLNSEDTIPTVAYTGAAGSITGIPDSKSYNFTTSTEVTDSKGVNHILSSYFIKSATANTYDVAYTFDGADYPAVPTPPASPTQFSVTFNSDGTYNSTTPSPVNLTPPLVNGAQALSFDIDYSSSTDFASPTVVQSVGNNGYTTGTITLVEVTSDGDIVGHYSNGQNQSLGTVQLASFAAPEGLQPIGSNMFSETSSSGQALISTPGSGTAGSINSGYLEGSNTDITTDLVQLGTASRNYKACSTVISTVKDMLDNLLRIV